MKFYKGYMIERNSWGWACLMDHGYVKADTLAGIKKLITATLKKY